MTAIAPDNPVSGSIPSTLTDMLANAAAGFESKRAEIIALQERLQTVSSTASSERRLLTVTVGPKGQPHLPGLSPCGCGDPSCRELTGGEFARGHDAKRKSRLWASARTGVLAIEELRRRGWVTPPEMR